MDDEKQEVFKPNPIVSRGSTTTSGSKHGVGYLAATGVIATIAATGITFALLQARPEVSPTATLSTPAETSAPVDDVTAGKVAGTDKATNRDEGGQQGKAQAEKGTTTSTTATTTPSTTTIPSTTTTRIEVVTVPGQQSASAGQSGTNADGTTQTWVEEQGHWEYDTVTDYEERTVYEEVADYMDTVIYYCSERDFESTDVSEVVAHCEAHGTSVRSEVRHVETGSHQEPVGTEMVPVGTHQEIGEWVVDVEGHWE